MVKKNTDQALSDKLLPRSIIELSSLKYFLPFFPQCYGSLLGYLNIFSLLFPRLRTDSPPRPRFRSRPRSRPSVRPRPPTRPSPFAGTIVILPPAPTQVKGISPRSQPGAPLDGARPKPACCGMHPPFLTVDAMGQPGGQVSRPVTMRSAVSPPNLPPLISTPIGAYPTNLKSEGEAGGM